MSPLELTARLNQRTWRPDSVVQYGSALLATALACAATYLVWSLIAPTVSLIFFVGVLFSAWYSGLKPALLSCLLSAIACNLFLSNTHGLHLGVDDLLRLTVFMLAAVTVSTLTMARAQAEEAAQQIQKQLAVTLKSVGDAVISCDVKTKVTAMNAVAQSLTGWSEAEARGRSIRDVFKLLDKDTRTESAGVVAQVMRTNAVIALDSSVLLVAKDGSEIPVNEIATPLRGANGSIAGVVLVLRNATTEQPSNDSDDEVFRQKLELLGSVDTPMCAVDNEGRCLLITKAASNLLGYRAEDIIGKDLHEVFHSADDTGLLCNGEECDLDAGLHGRPSQTPISETILQRNRNEVPVELSAAPILVADTILGTMVTMIDLTEGYRAREAQLKLETITDSLEEAVVLHSVEGMITDWSSSAEKIYGYAKEEVLGRHISIVHPPGLKSELDELFQRIAKLEKIVPFETVRLGKGGERINVLITIAPLKDPIGSVIGVSQIVRDITKEKAAREAESLRRLKADQSERSAILPPMQRHFSRRNAEEIKHSRPAARAEAIPANLAETSMVAMVGNSPVMKKLFSSLARIAPTDSSVLITGATGTGKELIARAIHQQSLRASGPFVDINCSAIPETLIEAELFGHQKGTFTGAHEHRAGLFEMASGGTLFLDEIDALNLAAQAKLLRVIQERRVRRIGGRTNIDVDVRIISATNSDLSLAIKDSRFRADLYYRLRVVPVHVPELYQREGDVALLIDHFLHSHAARNGGVPRRLTPEAMQALLDYPWPGNVRELENAIEYALAVAMEGDIGVEALPPELMPNQAPPTRGDLKQVLEAYMSDSVPLAEIEKRYILSVLRQFGGNQVKAAAALGIDRSKLYRRLKQYGILAVKFLQEEELDGMQLLASRDSKATSH